MSTLILLLFIAVFVALGFAGIALLSGGAIAASAAAADSASDEAEWSATWEGHEIVVRAEGSLGSLYVDGRLVGHGESLSSRVDGVEVLATIQQREGKAVARLHVDGRSRSLQRRPFGSPFQVGGPGPAATGRTPEDPRWEAVQELVDQIRAGGGEAAAVAGRAREELRVLLLKIDEAEKADAAHEALGADSDALDGVIAQHEVQVTRLVDALRELHFGALKAQPEPEEYARVLAALEVEIAGRAGS